MPLILLSVICIVLIVVLLVLGERTLPLFGGDRALAERAYKTMFMVLITGVVAGMLPAAFRKLSAFARDREAAGEAYPNLLRMAAGFFDTAGPWFAAVVGVGGLVLAVHIWLTH